MKCGFDWFKDIHAVERVELLKDVYMVWLYYFLNTPQNNQSFFLIFWSFSKEYSRTQHFLASILRYGLLCLQVVNSSGDGSR